MENKWNARSIKIARVTKDYTQKELSQKMGVRQQTISDWEKGKHPPKKKSIEKLDLHLGGENV